MEEATVDILTTGMSARHADLNDPEKERWVREFWMGGDVHVTTPAGTISRSW
jgi:hypothetical protein